MIARIFNPTSLCLCLPLMLPLGSTEVKAATLTGSGLNLPIPVPNPTWPPGVGLTRTPVAGGFNGTWVSPAHSDWIGTFSATGPIPDSSNSGTTLYDFSGLPNGVLPAGTFFLFSDFDGGSFTNETLDLTASIGSGSGPFVTLTEWLDDTYAVTGVGTGAASAILPGNMPGWDWNVTTTNAYRITGASVTGGNPSVGFALVSNQDISRLQLDKAVNFNSFGLRAPVVPEPASAALMGIGSLLVLARRRTST
jgi:hypothetical protein